MCDITKIRQFFTNYGKIIKSDSKMKEILENVKEQWDELATGVMVDEFNRETGKGLLKEEPESYGIMSSLINPDNTAEMLMREFGSSEQPPEGNVRGYFQKLATKKLKPLKNLTLD